MNKDILNTVSQDFINSNLDTDIVSLLFSQSDFESVSIKELAEQIEAKKKCQFKLPTWFNTKGIYYPNKLNIEQTSSEITAAYKATIIKGKTLIDLTGGFGIDAFYFSKSFNKVTHCELDQSLSEMVAHNFNVVGAGTITTIAGSGIAFLEASDERFDCIYIDPSRRHDSKGKVFYLKDCIPDVTKHLNLFFEHSNCVLIKASPMLDISIALNELKWVKEIHVVAVQNEVKELLFLIEHGFKNDISMTTVNIAKNQNQHFEFNITEEKNSAASYSSPQAYLYEPNSALLKAGAFNMVSKVLTIDKLHKHSHLYTSESLIKFPGKRFKINEVIAYSKKEVSKLFANKKANVITRNFPETVVQLRKKYKIKDGSDLFLFFTINLNNDKIVIVTTQLNK